MTSNGFQLQGEWAMSDSEDDDDSKTVDRKPYTGESEMGQFNGQSGMKGRMQGDVKDQAGRELPASERARLDRVER